MRTHRYEAGAGGASSRRHAALIAVAVASLLALCACNEDHPERGPEQRPARLQDSAGGEVERGAPSVAAARGRTALTDPTGSIGRPGSGRMRDGDPTDALVRGILAQMDSGELAITRVGQAKARNAQVRQYAATMVQAHQRELARAGARPAGMRGDLVTPLTEWQTKTLQRLNNVPAGPDFDREFMVRQLEAHESALAMLDQLEHSTTNLALETELRRRQHDVERHTAQALAVQMVASRPPPGLTTPGMSSPAYTFYVPSTAVAPESVGARTARPAATPAPGAAAPNAPNPGAPAPNVPAPRTAPPGATPSP